MEEVVSRLFAIANGMWKHRWQGVIAAWLVAAAGVIVVLKIPDRYEASARIYVDTQTILKPLMSGLAVQPNVDQQVVMLSRTLINRPNIEKLVRMADLDLRRESKVEQEERIEELMKTLQIRSTGRDNLYTLLYLDSEPDKAKRIIQSLVSIFVESSLGSSRKDTDAAKVFINEQIRNYQTKLEEAETRLKEFRLRNIELHTAGGLDTAGRLGELGALLDKARIELHEAENARDAAKAGLASENAQNSNVLTQSLLQESSLTVSTPELDARLEAQKRNLDTLLQRFTEQHPDVQSTRRVIKDLEEQKQKKTAELQRAAMATVATTPVANNSLASQELKRLLATSELQVASLRARVSEYASRYERARTMMKTAPQIEAEAAQLNRDYAIHKKNYEDLVARREAASMSGNLEVVSGMVDFRLIDPPRVSTTPVWPNRLLLLPLALAAALAAGLFTAFVASQLRPVFNRAVDLRDKVNLPLLGVVSFIASDADQRRERVDIVRFWVASGSLVGVFVAGLTIMSIMAGR
jgi:polysaccharide chain length determinant protein (PEP-CTERM system associated)